jgi:3-oxoacyl-[acyl-carrier protein] reductase
MFLKDQVALVTGGSRGIGRAIVQVLAREGAKVAFVYRGAQKAAEELVAEVTKSGGTAVAHQGDVAQAQTATHIVEKVLSDWGRVDILVNNAGIIRDGLFVRIEERDWDAVLDTNLGGVFQFCRALAMRMASQRSGRIINISSVAADFVNKGQCNYAASKGAVNSFTRALAMELAGRGVTVNAVSPGFIETDMSEAVRNKAGDMIQKIIPMKRLGKPEDVAAVVLFLTSAAASYVTGQIITVDGGLSLGIGGP